MIKASKDERIVVFDASTLITLAMNNLAYVLHDLKNNVSGLRFVAPESVKFESVKRPLKIPQFRFNALRVKELFDSGIVESPDILSISSQDINVEAKRISSVVNNYFFCEDKPVGLIHSGETDCLAICVILNKRGVDNVLAVDERTTRVLGENPENVRKLLRNKTCRVVFRKKGDVGNLDELRRISYIRSPEIVFVAWENGFIKPKTRENLEAAFHALQFKGASISEGEIRKLVSLAKKK